MIDLIDLFWGSFISCYLNNQFAYVRRYIMSVNNILNVSLDKTFPTS